jgi:Cathepsin propeptide inhibitor domain (I29)
MNTFNFLIIFCALARIGDAVSIEDQWKLFKINFNKSYKTPQEEEKRFEIFKENCEFFHEHNENETMTFEVGVNRDADLTHDETSKRLEIHPK